MATFEGTLADFTRYLDPYLRNTIQRGTRAHRSRLDHVCQACGRQQGHLESAHRRGRSKADIYRQVLAGYRSEGDSFRVPDVKQFMSKVIEAHKPFHETFLFLCKPCHDEYDERNKARQTTPRRVMPA